MLFNLSDQQSIAHQFLHELRDVKIQSDRMRFRKNMERLGELLAYEISKTLVYTEREIRTPLENCLVKTLDKPPVLLTILRAGIPFMNGFLSIFDHADVGFVGAYREEGHAEVRIKLDYLAIPSIENRSIILADPMLATGMSLVRAIEILLKRGKPEHIHVAALIATPAGIDRVNEFLKTVGINFSLWTCAVDEKLNDQFYIVPGLGDAGDLSFGYK